MRISIWSFISASPLSCIVSALIFVLNVSNTVLAASSSERFPSVRANRWNNFESVKKAEKIDLPKNCKAVRIHASGDFFSQKYFDLWLQTAINNPNVEFWAYKKSLNYWVNRLDKIPDNFVLTASRGGKFDDLIEKYNLKNVTVIHSYEKDQVHLIDVKDRLARKPNLNFYLLENKKMKDFLKVQNDI